MPLRKPAVAGSFYPDSARQCLAEIAECLPAGPISSPLPDRITAGIVPHAGWVFSGWLAAMVFAAVKQVNGDTEIFILFGASHRCHSDSPVIFPQGAWETPLGQIDIHPTLTEQFIALGAKPDLHAHRQEHSIEVQIPFIQHLFPKAALVAVLMPPAANGYECRFGSKIGALLKDSAVNAVCIASTDLTHYGPRYGFAPQGTGQAGIQWAHQVNDMDFINKALAMDAKHLVETSIQKDNACGPAATAAVVAAAETMGCKKGYLLAHTNSADVAKARFRQTSTESVGYAAIVF